MNLDDWYETLPQKHQDAIAEMDEGQVMEYLSDNDIELPDEFLEGVTGGINPFAILFQRFRRRSRVKDSKTATNNRDDE